MADNYTQVTISPNLSASMFSEEELRALKSACGLTCETYYSQLYFFAETCFCEQGEDDDGFGVNCLALMQEKLRQLDPDDYPHISIQGASTSSKMRPDEFGGFAFLITRDAIRSMSTWQWLHEQTHPAPGLPATAA